MKRLAKIIFLIMCSCGTISSTIAQSTDPANIASNGIYLELYAIRHDFNNGFVSINYERSLGKRKGMAARLGVYPDFETLVTFPVSLTFLTKPLNRHHFEYGFGAVYRMEFFEGRVLHDMPAVLLPLMYRYQGEGPWFFRGGINLFVSFPTTPSLSASAGYRF